MGESNPFVLSGMLVGTKQALLGQRAGASSGRDWRESMKIQGRKNEICAVPWVGDRAGFYFGVWEFVPEDRERALAIHAYVIGFARA